MTNDTELLDWLDEHSYGLALVHDDGELWAVLGCGTQTCEPGNTIGFATNFWTLDESDAARWKPTVREAILYAKEHTT